jgi:hypothetical protein
MAGVGGLLPSTLIGVEESDKTEFTRLSFARTIGWRGGSFPLSELPLGGAASRVCGT